MGKKYKGFKGSGMHQKKMAEYKLNKLVAECFIRYFATEEGKRFRQRHQEDARKEDCTA